MKFKIGDRVKLLKNKMKTSHCRETILRFRNEETGVIRNINYGDSTNNINIEFDDGYNNCYCYEDEIMKIMAKPTKEELFKMPLGTIIKTDKEKYNVFVKVGESDFCNNICDHIEDNYVNDDLSLECFGNKIIEIEEPTYQTIYKADDEVKEMTIAEIEKELGYPIKVVKEEE